MILEILNDDNFEKEIKNFYKKYLSIYKDLEIFKEILQERYNGLQNIESIKSKHTHILSSEEDMYVIKDRFMCRSLKGKNMRIVHIFDKSKDKIIFLELFFKGDKDNEDRKFYNSKLKEILKDL